MHFKNDHPCENVRYNSIAQSLIVDSVSVGKKANPELQKVPWE